MYRVLCCVSVVLLLVGEVELNLCMDGCFDDPFSGTMKVVTGQSRGEVTHRQEIDVIFHTNFKTRKLYALSFHESSYLQTTVIDGEKKIYWSRKQAIGTGSAECEIRPLMGYENIDSYKCLIAELMRRVDTSAERIYVPRLNIPIPHNVSLTVDAGSCQPKSAVISVTPSSGNDVEFTNEIRFGPVSKSLDIVKMYGFERIPKNCTEVSTPYVLPSVHQIKLAIAMMADAE